MLNHQQDGSEVDAMTSDVFSRALSTAARVRPRWWVLVGLSAVLVAAALVRGWLRGWSVEIAVPIFLFVSNLYLAFRDSRATLKRPSDVG